MPGGVVPWPRHVLLSVWAAEAGLSARVSRNRLGQGQMGASSCLPDGSHVLHLSSDNALDPRWTALGVAPQDTPRLLDMLGVGHGVLVSRGVAYAPQAEVHLLQARWQEAEAARGMACRQARAQDRLEHQALSRDRPCCAGARC